MGTATLGKERGQVWRTAWKEKQKIVQHSRLMKRRCMQCCLKTNRELGCWGKCFFPACVLLREERPGLLVPFICWGRERNLLERKFMVTEHCRSAPSPAIVLVFASTKHRLKSAYSTMEIPMRNPCLLGERPMLFQPCRKHGTHGTFRDTVLASL